MTEVSKTGNGQPSDDNQRGDGCRPIRVFMASPSDLAVERQAFVEVVEDLNDGFAAGAGVHVDALRWENLPSSYGRRPQDVINQMIDSSDVFILCLHRRWGQPVQGSGFSSYTEEEFRRAEALFLQKAKPHIFVLFKRLDSTLLDDIGPQLAQVLKFKRQLADEGRTLYREFESVQDFRKEVSEHLKLVIKGPPSAELVSSLLPQVVLDALRQGIPPIQLAREEYLKMQKSIEDLQAASKKFMHDMYKKATGNDLPKTDDDDDSKMRWPLDQALIRARDAVKAASQIANHPDIRAFFKAVEGFIEIIPPKAVSFDPVTLKNLRLMKDTYERDMEEAKKGSLTEFQMELHLNTLDSWLAYEESKLDKPETPTLT